jgi:hypothetical protein
MVIGNKSPCQEFNFWKGEITSQNHGFAVNKDELEANSDLEITHVHQMTERWWYEWRTCFSVQYHNLTHDSSYLFDQFIQNLKDRIHYFFYYSSRGFLINLRKPGFKKVFASKLLRFEPVMDRYYELKLISSLLK